MCDDHQLLLEALATALAHHGFVVEATVNSPADAVRAVALHDPDMLMIDVHFPQGCGIEAARQVMARHPRTKVVMITASDDPAPMVKALAAGVAGYLRKDQQVEAIARSLHAAARGENPIDLDLLRQVRRPRSREARPPRHALSVLTHREQHVFRLLAAGMSTREMVSELGVSHSTIRTHVQNIFSKLGVHTRLQAVALIDTESVLETLWGSHADNG